MRLRSPAPPARRRPAPRLVWVRRLGQPATSPASSHWRMTDHAAALEAQVMMTRSDFVGWLTMLFMESPVGGAGCAAHPMNMTRPDADVNRSVSFILMRRIEALQPPPQPLDLRLLLLGERLELGGELRGVGWLPRARRPRLQPRRPSAVGAVPWATVGAALARGSRRGGVGGAGDGAGFAGGAAGGH